MESMTDEDDRFLSVDVDTVNNVTLEDAETAIMSQLQPRNLEISVAGDFDVQEVLDMMLKYVGSISPDANSEFDLEKEEEDTSAEKKSLPKVFGSVPVSDTGGEFLELELSDPDPRAIAYVAGSAPNMWGTLADGTTVAE